MGFGDEGIVALSGAHTLGRAFKVKCTCVGFQHDGVFDTGWQCSYSYSWCFTLFDLIWHGLAFFLACLCFETSVSIILWHFFEQYSVIRFNTLFFFFTCFTCFVGIIDPVYFLLIVSVGKERRTLIGPWWPAKAAPVTETALRTTGPVPADSRQFSAIGTRLRDPINLGLTRWRMGV